jgi:hypothetical protein
MSDNFVQPMKSYDFHNCEIDFRSLLEDDYPGMKLVPNGVQRCGVHENRIQSTWTNRTVSEITLITHFD